MLTNTSSARNLKFTVHWNMKTLPRSKEFLMYSSGKVRRKGRPRMSCRAAQIDKHRIVSCKPAPRRRTSKTPGAWRSMFIFTDTAHRVIVTIPIGLGSNSWGRHQDRQADRRVDIKQITSHKYFKIPDNE